MPGSKSPRIEHRDGTDGNTGAIPCTAIPVHPARRRRAAGLKCEILLPGGEGQAISSEKEDVPLTQRAASRPSPIRLWSVGMVRLMNLLKARSA
ncbi:hypothetical protein GCM10008949_32300 [Deinococcus humi]|nr:hypothetical protein GCM10008949_32300 [Deinococcus humi]